MINRASLDPSLPTPTDTRSHAALVQEIARHQTRLGRLARAAAPAPVAGTAGADRLARMADAQASAEIAATARHFEITSERLRAMSTLAAAARAADLSQRTRDNASRQFEAMKWQALEALHNAAGAPHLSGAWQLYLDPSQIGQAVAAANIGTPDQAAAATAALNAALSVVDQQRHDIAESATSGEAAQALDPAELAQRIAEQATTSANAQANIEPADARLLLS